MAPFVVLALGVFGLVTIIPSLSLLYSPVFGYSPRKVLMSELESIARPTESPAPMMAMPIFYLDDAMRYSSSSEAFCVSRST